jgi:chemotaxis protein CheZ
MPGKQMKVFTAERTELAESAPVADQSGVTNADLLQAIEQLRRQISGEAEGDGSSGNAVGEIDEEIRAAQDNLDAIRSEIGQMANTIEKAKVEIAAIKHPLAEDDQMMVASNQMDSIVNATETATHTILGASEMVEDVIKRMVAVDPENSALLSLSEEAGGHLIRVMEACGFQDITGQRVTKVIKTLRFIEDRVASIIGIWGVDAFAGIAVENEDDKMTDEDALLQGPQDVGQGISQSDIDALFD